MTTINKEFIRDKLIPFIKKEAENDKFKMSAYFSDMKGFMDYYSNKSPICETAACIAGSVVVLEIGKFKKEYPNRFKEDSLSVLSHSLADYGKFARQLLGINAKFAEELFLADQAYENNGHYEEGDNDHDYITSSFGMYNGTPLEEITAEQVIQVLEEIVNGLWDQQASI